MPDKNLETNPEIPQKPKIGKPKTDFDIEPPFEHDNVKPDTTSKNIESLLNVDSYQEVEALLSHQPDLIEHARVVFGQIVPTGHQSEFIDLVIRTSATDESMNLKSALKLKRHGNVDLSLSEVEQLLEFANEQINQVPELAFNIALLLTDDLTNLEVDSLWRQQEVILKRLESELDVNTIDLWEHINPTELPKAIEPDEIIDVEIESESIPEPEWNHIEFEAEPEFAEPPKHDMPFPPPPLPKMLPTIRKPNRRQAGKRFLMATGVAVFMIAASCGGCASALLFFFSSI